MPRKFFLRFILISVLTAFGADGEAQIPPIPSAAQRSMERILGRSGSYVPSESVFKIRIPKTGFPIESWVAFSPEIRGGGMMMGELQLLETEVNPVATAILDAGLDINGLANATLSDPLRLLTMNISGTGSFDSLAGGVRKALDVLSAAQTKTSAARPAFPKSSSIDGEPIDAVLSMKGTVVNGIYRAAIGQISVLNNTPFGKEMGASTSLTFAGTNQDATVQGEIVASADQLQRVLKALRAKRLDLISIRNHTIGEHPQLVFVRFTGNGTALDLAKAVRYALDVQVGALKPA
jgi:hypothetical protein